MCWVLLCGWVPKQREICIAEKNSDSAPRPRIKRGRNISVLPIPDPSVCVVFLPALALDFSRTRGNEISLSLPKSGMETKAKGRGNSVSSCDIPYSPRARRRQLGDISLSIHDSHDHSAEKLVVGSACVCVSVSRFPPNVRKSRSLYFMCGKKVSFCRRGSLSFFARSMKAQTS